jgi:hypothetical protein
MKIMTMFALFAYAMAGKCHDGALPNEEGWCDCSGRADLEVGSVKFFPENRLVKRGENITLSAEFYDHADYAITGGHVTEYAEVNGKHTMDKNLDLCDVTQCPLAARERRTLSFTESIPADADGRMVVKIQSKDQNGHEMLCLLYEAHISGKGKTLPITPTGFRVPDFVTKNIAAKADCCLDGDCCTGVTFCCKPCAGSCQCCH